MSGQALSRHAGGLSAQLKAGERWVLWDHDPAAFCAALLACWQAGATAILPGNGQPGTLALIEADGLISSEDLVFTGRQLDPLAFDGEPCCPAVLPIVLFTSGSTGEPKAVDKSAEQLLSELGALSATFGPLRGAVLATVSHQHIYGLLFRLLWPLVSGAAVARETISYPEQLDAMATALPGPLALVASPAHLERLPDAFMVIGSRLDALFSSGGLLGEQGAAQAHQRLGVMPTEVFGSTETGGVAWRRQGQDRRWTPFAGVDCQTDAEGGLVVSSIVAGGCQSMGDRVEIGPDGRFALLGRRDRIVKVEQKRLSLDAMEQALIHSPMVNQARCLLLEGRRQQLGAVLVLTEPGHQQLAHLGKHAFYQQLRQGLLADFEPVVLPRRWRLVQHLPVNAQGKVTNLALSALFDE